METTSRKTKSSKFKSKLIINENVEHHIDNFFYRLNIEKTQDSCGIIELGNFNDSYRNLCMNSSNKVLGKYLIQNLRKLYNKYSSALENTWSNNNRYAYLMISLNDKADKILISYLNKYASHSTNWKVNTNTDNKIKIWFF